MRRFEMFAELLARVAKIAARHAALVPVTPIVDFFVIGENGADLLECGQVFIARERLHGVALGPVESVLVWYTYDGGKA